MRVFVTGASGAVGTAVVAELLKEGHTVSGLARSEKSLGIVKDLGATPVQGGLEDFDILQREASQADAIIHTAFDHEAIRSGDFLGACEKDYKAIEAMCATLLKHNNETSPKIFLNSSGVLGNQGTDEHASAGPSPRAKSSGLVHEYGQKGLRALDIRLAPITHNTSRPHLFILAALGASSRSGFIPYTGKSWAACSVPDAARLYVLALTKGPATGSLHAIAEESVAISDIFNFVAQKTGKTAKALSAEDASKQLGMIANFMSLGEPASSKLTREWTGWETTGPTLMDQLDKYDWTQ